MHMIGRPVQDSLVVLNKLYIYKGQVMKYIGSFQCDAAVPDLLVGDASKGVWKSRNSKPAVLIENSLNFSFWYGHASSKY